MRREFSAGQKDPWWVQYVELKDIKRSADLMFLLGLNETMDQLAMADSVLWYDNV